MSLTAPRATNEMLTARHRSLPMAANTKLWQGSIAMLVNGLVQPGSAIAAGIALGCADFTADNSTGAAGAINANVKRGVFNYANAAADPVLAAQVGQVCYVLDDQTVAATSAANSRPVAGKVFNLDADGSVWVEFI